MAKKKNGKKSFKKYFEEGRLSKMKGLLLEENPYEEEDLIAAEAWEQGWSSIEEIEDVEGC
jgi:endo-alpha-1,4-polygalactosaminidase (GH114 family)